MYLYDRLSGSKNPLWEVYIWKSNVLIPLVKETRVPGHSGMVWGDQMKTVLQTTCPRTIYCGFALGFPNVLDQKMDAYFRRQNNSRHI